MEAEEQGKRQYDEAQCGFVCVCVCVLFYFWEASGFRKAIQFSNLDLSLKGTWVLFSKHDVNSEFGIGEQTFFMFWPFDISDASPYYIEAYTEWSCSYPCKRAINANTEN